MPRQKTYGPAFISCLICLCISLASAADFWAKKTYQNWSADETRRMLEESPWAATVTVPGYQTNATSRRAWPFQPDVGSTITYTVQFRSARPIQEARVRCSQLSSKYDSMSAEKKAAFEAEANRVLAVTYADRVVIAITFSTIDDDMNRRLQASWKSDGLLKFIASIYLTTQSGRFKPVHYTLAENTFLLTFPRPARVQSDDKISIEFYSPAFSFYRPESTSTQQQRVFQEFSVKKMILNGEPVF